MLTFHPSADDAPVELGALVAHRLADLFPMMSADEHAALVADMRENGFREGCEIILYEGQILDGRNRYSCAREAGVTPLVTNFFASRDGDPLRYVISRNLNRRHLNETQRAWVASQVASYTHGGDRRSASDQAANLPLETEAPKNSANLPNKAEGVEQRDEPAPKVSQADAAKLFNVSERSVRDAAKVGKSGIDELNEAVRAGHLSISAAAKAAMLPPETQRRIAQVAASGKANVVRKVLKQEGRAKREAELGAKQCALPEKKYGVILADPEWRFKTWSEAGMDRAADNHYPTSELTDIAAREVVAISAEDCVLYLWVTRPMLEMGLVVMRAWGFAYVSCHGWDKEVGGTGYWNIDDLELLLIGTKGDVPCPAPGTQERALLHAKRGQHSAKPEAVAEMIEALFPTLPKIELNRRGPARPGWDAWGNEAETGALTEEQRALVDANGMVRVSDNMVVAAEFLTEEEWARALGKAAAGEVAA
ncbi:hypothetical protein A7A08_01684 [Methyloligella halotolerans]|uniref:Uncharacterized protein n=1 Tax=Methyloligella halotolerans TaxID=1177755 RepID=A0A1E2S020_9HYPH|nr:MT-A70 family methyltransferase [Methyloligella halotolerans]ODA67649.1 hypothetical protein A7A08_01684 [Methyloligella halotolerans]